MRRLYDVAGRVPSSDGDSIVWRETVVTAPDRPEPPVAIGLPPALVESACRLERGLREIEVDLSPQPFLIGKPGERQQVPFMLIALDTDSQFVLCTEFLALETTAEGVYSQAPRRLLEALVKFGARPAIVAWSNWRLDSVLPAAARAIGAAAARKKRLRVLEQVTRELLAYMARR